MQLIGAVIAPGMVGHQASLSCLQRKAATADLVVPTFTFFVKVGTHAAGVAVFILASLQLIDSHRALFPKSVLRGPITARLARFPIALHHCVRAAFVPIRDPLPVRPPSS